MVRAERAESYATERAFTVDRAIEPFPEKPLSEPNIERIGTASEPPAPALERPGSPDFKATLRWNGHFDAPETGPIHVDRSRSGDRVINRDTNKLIARYTGTEQPIAFVLGRGHAHLAVLENTGAIKVYAVANRKKVAETSAVAQPVSPRAFVPGLAFVAGSLALAQTQLAHGHAAAVVGAVAGAAMLLNTAHAWLSDRARQRTTAHQAVVAQTIAFSNDGRSLDRVVPGGLQRLNLSTGYDNVFTTSEAKSLKSIAGPVRAALSTGS